MIYSVHNPVSGAFDYFEGGPATAINDDLPTPQLRAGRIGVAATSAARPLPPGCRKVGSGALPVGSISSGKPGMWKGTSKGGVPSGIAGLGEDPGRQYTYMMAGAAAVAVLAAGYLLVSFFTQPQSEYEYASVQRRPW